MASEVWMRLVDGLKFDVRTGNGAELRIDSPKAGEDPTGPSPVELVLVGLGGCGAMDVISILRKMRQEVTDYALRVTGERAEDHPRVFTSAVIHHFLRGRGLHEESVRRAIYLSMSRYCPVFAMLAPTVPIAVRYEITDEETGEVRAGYVQTDMPEPKVEAP